MFTGLIQSIGKIKRYGAKVLIDGCEPFAPIKLGDSIAVDGVCLTVSECISNGFLSDVSEETLSRTTLGGKADLNSFVNLEPALKLTDRLGGHLVSGHVDGIGEVKSIDKLRYSWIVEIRWKNKEFSRYICNKASICLDGISLTVAESSENGTDFSIAVIPHTWENTSLHYLSVGKIVNLEVDLMAKYAEKLLNNKNSVQYLERNNNSDVSRDWLQEQGWS